MAAIEDLIANSARFQGAVGAADADQARANIFHFASTRSVTPPVAVIFDFDQFEFNRLGTNTSLPSGSTRVVLVGSVDRTKVNDDGTIDNAEDAVTAFRDLAAQVADDMNLLGQAPGFLGSGTQVDGSVEQVDQADRALARGGGADPLISQDLIVSFGFAPES